MRSRFSGLLETFAPWARPRTSFHYSDIARERGCYGNALAGYLPYLGDHPRPCRVRGRAVERVFDALMRSRGERIAQVTALLARHGIAVEATPPCWDRIGDWLAETVEASREPGLPEPGSPEQRALLAKRYVVDELLRPCWVSVALDLDLLLGEHVIAKVPGARWTHPGAPGREPEVPSAELAIEYGRSNGGRPSGWLVPGSESVALGGLRQRHGLAPVIRGHLGNYLRHALAEPDGPDREAERRAAIEKADIELRAHLFETGELPPTAEVVELLDGLGLGPDDLAVDLREMLDARARAEHARGHDRGRAGD